MFRAATSSTPATNAATPLSSTAMSLSSDRPSLDDDRTLPTLLRPNDVVRLFAVSRAWVYEAARTGRIPSVRLGGEDGPLRFVAADLEQWLAEARACQRLGGSRHTVPAESKPPRS